VTNIKKNFSRTLLATIAICLSVLLYQNCSDVRLKPVGVGTFSSTNYPLQIKPPTMYPPIKRYVMLIDMSDSMVQGPCPFDVDVNDDVHGYSGYYAEWDPNPGKGDPNAVIGDHRGRVQDCYVDPTLPAGQVRVDRPAGATFTTIVNHATFKGADTEKWRLSVVRKWMQELRANVPPGGVNNVKVLIWPVSGGLPFTRLLKNYPLPKEFVSINDPRIDQTIGNLNGMKGYLEETHNIEYNKALLPVIQRWNNDLAQGNGVLETKMGPTSIGEVLTSVFTPINLDFQNLAFDGLLTNTDLNIFLFGDGHITPLQKHFEEVQNMWGGCTCVGSSCELAAADCASLYDDMKISWGEPDANTTGALDVKISAYLGLPRYYGGGYVNTQFMHINPAQFDARSATTSEINIFDTLTGMFEARGVRLKNWPIESPIPPFSLVPTKAAMANFKLTHFFILNPNVRIGADGQKVIDSDGDGLPDNEEAPLGFDVSKTRTNGGCLDSIMANPTLGPLCAALVAARNCDPSIDSDGDSLNECEEEALGTDAYDFDTDGDGIPDTLEWLNGFNPLIDDSKLDSNGDGLANIVHFSSGVPSKVDPRTQPKGLRVDIEVNFVEQVQVDDPQLGPVLVDKYNILLHGMPIASLIPVDESRQGDLYLSRLVAGGAGKQNVLIHPTHRLIKSSSTRGRNVMMALLRLVDVREPEKISWEILELPFDESLLKMSSQIDLSRFEQIRVMDRNIGGGK